MPAHLVGTAPGRHWGKSSKGRSGGSARKLGGGRFPYPLFCPSSAKGGSPRCPADSQPPQISKPGYVPAERAGEAGNGSFGLPQPTCRGPCSPLAPEDAPLSERALQVANSPSTQDEVLCSQGGASSATFPQPLETLCRGCPSVPPLQPHNPPQTHTPSAAPPRISRSPSPTRRRAPSPDLTNTHTHPLRLHSPGPRRSRSEYLAWQCSVAEKGRARSPRKDAERFSNHPQWWLFSFPGTGGRRGVGGEGEGEEPRGGKSRAGTTSSGSTLSLAQST